MDGNTYSSARRGLFRLLHESKRDHVAQRTFASVMSPGEALTGDGGHSREGFPIPGSGSDRASENVAQAGSADLCHPPAVGTVRGLMLPRINCTMASMAVPGWKIAATPICFRWATSWSGMIPPTTTITSSILLLFEQIHDARDDRIVCTRKNRQPDDVNVFLHGGAYDHLRSLTQAGVDDFHASIAQSSRNDLGASVMPVKTRLRDQHTDFLLSGIFSLQSERFRIQQRQGNQPIE